LLHRLKGIGTKIKNICDAVNGRLSGVQDFYGRGSSLLSIKRYLESSQFKQYILEPLPNTTMRYSIASPPTALIRITNKLIFLFRMTNMTETATKKAYSMIVGRIKIQFLF
jgi:hypothetical protein